MSVETFTYVVPELGNLWHLFGASAAVGFGGLFMKVATSMKNGETSPFIENVAIGSFIFGCLGSVVLGGVAGDDLVAAQTAQFNEYATTTFGLQEEAAQKLWLTDEIVEDEKRYELLPNGDDETYTIIVTDLEDAE